MTPQNPLLLLTLTLGASLSPLLTVAYLWQLKEWRVDRMMEHLRYQNGLIQLFGFVRPTVVVGFGVIEFLDLLPEKTWPIVVLGVLTMLNLTQISFRRQPRPVWTKKAIMILFGSIVLTTILFVVLYQNAMPALGILPLLQPFVLLLSWLLFKPLDFVLKKRIMRRAKLIRTKFPDLTVIGITGSVGKTTTKELLAHLLGEKHMLCTPAHVNTEMGVSQWLSRELPKHPETKIMIVEMGAYRKGEIALLCSIAKPTMGIITFIGTQHLGLFGSQEALLSAKSELLRALPKDGHAFLNGDSPFIKELKEVTPCAMTVVSTGGHSDLEAFEIEETGTGIQFKVGQTPVEVALQGTHNITNVLLAIAAAEKVGITLEECATRLKSYKPSASLKTFAVRTEHGVMLLDDTNNASPTSFQAALHWAQNQPFEKKILLTSGLIELGEAQDRIHTELGTMASGLFDRVIFLSAKSAHAFERGYGQAVEIYSKQTQHIPKDALLLCIGRIKPSTISLLTK